MILQSLLSPHARHIWILDNLFGDTLSLNSLRRCVSSGRVLHFFLLIGILEVSLVLWTSAVCPVMY
ncbi:hypothetical protein GALMADRAFT_798860 [Galerina marginata CBS 339.88]|uniref:Uncharacterized protein n=1 Tax=Galerina marginata (strain CBS 339.88) TaxID=685588 RepID=A0A067SK94_GALM3|nr:hypothetical protein GALMADRAFT_798860 [Galerina marginata CBS 339.88]